VCETLVQFLGRVTPSDYQGQITLRRFISSGAAYYNSTQFTPTGISYAPGTSDTSQAFLCVYPRAAGYLPGNVYDADAPGEGSNSTAYIFRQRVNLKEYAVLGNQFSQWQVGNVVPWWSDTSCLATGIGTGNRSNDVPGDNSSGTGTTITTWNLQ
jgi:hypothetical protein